MPGGGGLNVTRLIDLANKGDSQAAEELLPLVYEELRKLARARLAHEAPGHTLQATALVHEAYVRLLGDDATWNSRGHFFGAAALAMRRILVERARSHARIKRGGDGEQRAGRVELDDGAMAINPPSEDVLAVDEALDKLRAYDEGKARIVMLRYFAGLTVEETAMAMGLTVAQVKGEWSYARAWLHREMTKGDPDAPMLE